jgi:acetyl-CoA synthase
MSQFVLTTAIRGAHAVVGLAEEILAKTIAEKGPAAKVGFPDTAYYLPVIFGMNGQSVETLADLQPALADARKRLAPVGSTEDWSPSLEEALGSGMATLISAEAIKAVTYAKEEGVGPISDVQLRTWGIQLVDGRMPGVAAILGCAKSNEVAVKIVRELQKRNILCLLAGSVDGRSIIDQLLEEGVELGPETYTMPLGRDTASAVYALGFAVRAALTFGGRKGGQAAEILDYNQKRVPAFVLALGAPGLVEVAAAAGALNFGFPIILDSAVIGVGSGDGPLVSLPFDEIAGEDDLARAAKLVQKCMDVRGIKVRITEVPVPVPYGSAFEGEVVRRADMRIEFGGKYAQCFEYLRMAGMDEVEDGRVTVVGPGFGTLEPGAAMPMGILVEAAGAKMEKDFEPVLERQIHHFVNCASGIQHVGQRDIVWIRISKAAADKSFDVEHLGKILHARFHADFGAIVDKVQVTIFTDPEQMKDVLAQARAAYDFRNKRLADLTDDRVDEFYSCTLCQSFAPNHVCVVSPERLGLCGAYNWLDCKASFSINPTGPNQPIQLGEIIDDKKGYWAGTNDYAKIGSHGAVEQVSMYSIMENPMTACGCFECIVMLIPEANGVMVVSREDTSMTPAGMTFSTLAGIAGGGQQTPGVMGVGKFYLVSPKFISADGGFPRIVWMSSVLKETMADELRTAAERAGDPDLLEKIADERSVTTVEDLLAWLEAHNHPAMAMEPMF